LADILILKTDAVVPSEMSVNLYQSIRRRNVDVLLHSHRCENLRPTKCNYFVTENAYVREYENSCDKILPEFSHISTCAYGKRVRILSEVFMA
jgi:hypothetical protein